MADPLSIAASIAGLLAAAGKVYTVVSGFIDSTANAPQSAAATLEAVGEIKLALSSVQSMIDSLHHLSASRKGLIQLEHLAIIITNAVFTLSKLESLVCQKDGFRYRLRSVWNEKRVLSLLPRLESQKASLTLIVSVLQSHSNAEALLCYDEMLVKMEEVLEQNRTLGQHLRLMEDRGPLDVRSVKFMDDAMSIMSSRRSLRSMTSLPFSRARPSSSLSSRQIDFARWDFEIALQRSRVYSRSHSNQCDVSYTTSTAHTNAWSMLSGLSLNDISVVSAFRLPITLNDVHLVAPGSTFSAMFMEQALPTRPQGKLRRATMQNTSYPKPAMAWNRQTSIRSLISTSMETPEIPVARKVPSMESSRALPKIKVVVIGDSNALKSKMIHTFMGDAPVAAHADIPKGSDCSRSTVKVNDIYVDLELHDTTGVEDYSSLLNMACSEVDVFLFLSRKYSDTQFQSVGERWVPEISGIFPGVPYLVVGTHEGRDEEILDEDLAKFAASSVRGRKLAEALESVRYVDCDVGDVQAVQALIGQWWLQRR
ncbi:Cell division control protein 42-like protein [Colletotrichum fructicola Nara gc5]|uniref:Cell division control protein 42-like protein n=1 Tax=Colletotrichum fructicola (strain Nara gc5) TaxID=1213859 RepID=A0A7J6IYR1_COLFN|nr:Cell division control protein 42-like protein [Colletotrichum fructicola Nara gc5]